MNINQKLLSRRLISCFLPSTHVRRTRDRNDAANISHSLSSRDTFYHVFRFIFVIRNCRNTARRREHVRSRYDRDTHSLIRTRAQAVNLSVTSIFALIRYTRHHQTSPRKSRTAGETELITTRLGRNAGADADDIS